MTTNTFFVCPNCGNVKKFKIFTCNFQVIEQSPEMGVRVGESGVLPSLRQNDNYVECQLCLKKLDYDMIVDIGRRYMQETQGSEKKSLQLSALSACLLFSMIIEKFKQFRIRTYLTRTSRNL